MEWNLNKTWSAYQAVKTALLGNFCLRFEGGGEEGETWRRMWLKSVGMLSFLLLLVEVFFEFKKYGHFRERERAQHVS